MYFKKGCEKERPAMSSKRAEDGEISAGISNKVNHF